MSCGNGPIKVYILKYIYIYLSWSIALGKEHTEVTYEMHP